MLVRVSSRLAVTLLNVERHGNDAEAKSLTDGDQVPVSEQCPTPFSFLQRSQEWALLFVLDERAILTAVCAREGHPIGTELFWP